ncbi:heme-binding domain-containing protein [Maribellus sediminis]|uniref:heme-binding domain-containing protein n=1 Tax=Maribellus sediminis TaxID=2696285 RepID=UPI0014300474|nr:heme-binding domain-containing protein [Maribellus sediminis]
MRKILRIVFIILIVGFVVLQFFQPEKNQGQITDNDILRQHQVPENIAVILKESCFDCHSNNTRYPFYDRVAPVSWMVDDHIQDGKHELNFSEWGEMDIFDKITTLDEIARETKRKAMPLKSYKLMHPKARLSDEQIAAIEKWTTELGEELLKNSISE